MVGGRCCEAELQCSRECSFLFELLWGRGKALPEPEARPEGMADAMAAEPGSGGGRGSDAEHRPMRTAGQNRMRWPTTGRKSQQMVLRKCAVTDAEGRGRSRGSAPRIEASGRCGDACEHERPPFVSDPACKVSACMATASSIRMF